MKPKKHNGKAEQTTTCVPTDTSDRPESVASIVIRMHSSMVQITPKLNPVSLNTRPVVIVRAAADMPVLRSDRVVDTNLHIDSTQAHLKPDQDHLVTTPRAKVWVSEAYLEAT